MSCARRCRTRLSGVGSRERKRAERRKRKRRAAVREAAPPDNDGEQLSTAAEPAPQPSASELRDAQARDTLEPLHEGERPLVVTIGAAVATLVAVSIVIAYLAGAEVGDERPGIGQVVAPTALMAVMAWGMWRVRYWAVLGFQVVLAFLILAAALGLVQAVNAIQVVGNFVLMAIAGTFFYFMVKGLARIQMPERLPPK